MKDWIKHFNSKKNIPRIILFCLFLTIIISNMLSNISHQFPESSVNLKKEIYLQNTKFTFKGNMTQDLNKGIANLSITDR